METLKTLCPNISVQVANLQIISINRNGRNLPRTLSVTSSKQFYFKLQATASSSSKRFPPRDEENGKNDSSQLNERWKLFFGKEPQTESEHLTASAGNRDIPGALELHDGRFPNQPTSPGVQYNGVFLLLLLNLCVFVADHVLNFPMMRQLYLYHMDPRWYQFVTATFCHASWGHLSGNLFFVYVFGKLVEELEGSFGVLATYLITGVGANIFSWVLLPSSMVSAGASGAVFGLFAVSVLIRVSWDWRKILEVIILGQFVIEKVTSEAQASVSNGGIIMSNVPAVNHVAHLAGALVGALLIWSLTRVPSKDDKISS